MSQYDVVVIGSGPGGYVAAIYAAQCGLKTALIEREPTERLGGTCLLRGCIPTKAMLQTADLIDKVRHSEDFGISLQNPEVNMEKMDEFRARIVAKNSNGVQHLMRKNKVDVHFGHGRVHARHKVSVSPLDGGEPTILETKHAIIATGSQCRELSFLPTDGERIINSDHILEMTELPEHLIVLGAGAVGSEFASVYLRYGSKVTLIEMMEHVLPIEDHDVCAQIEKSFKRQGMKVLTKSKLTDATVHDGGVRVIVETEGKGSQTIEGSHLLVAAGRSAVTGDVGLQETDVVVDERGYIEVDDYMRTQEDWIFAIGDCIDTAWLAHVASHEGTLAIDTICENNPRPLNYDHVPNCTYCSPEVASVGLTEREAKARGYDVKVGTFPFVAIAKAAIVGQSDGFVKIVSESRYDELLGLHIIGPKATELITEGTVALELESTVAELVHAIHPHPTLAEAVGEAAHATLGHSINF